MHVTMNTRSARDQPTLVFAGGGSLGAVHVGMLKALLDHGLRPARVLGSSVGAINAAYLAGAPSRDGVDQLERIWRGLGRRQIFPVRALGGLLGLMARRDHLVDPSNLRQLLARELPFEQLEDAQLPLTVVATEVLGGREVALTEGPALSALLASAAIPGIFPPVEWEGRMLMDGGVAANTPLTAAVQTGARRVIVLPTGTTCAAERMPRGVLGMSLHALTLLIARQLVRDLEKVSAEVSIRVVPPLCPLMVGAYDFSHAADLIDAAEDSTAAWIESGGLTNDVGVPESLVPHAHQMPRD